MNPLLRLLATAAVLLLWSSAPFAQDIIVGTGVPAIIPDDGYIGTGDKDGDATGVDAGMVCADFDNTGGTILSVSDVSVDLAITHTWVGDLIIKLQSPAGTVLAMQNVAGATGCADDGATCGVGTNDDLDGSILNYSDTGTTDAEDMGAGGIGVCSGDGLCDYFPNPDNAGGVTNFSGFSSEVGVGMWQLCVGDQAALDDGTLDVASLTILGSTVDTEGPADGVPGTHALSELYPNPFNPQSSFTLAVAQTQDVLINVVNLLGQHVATLHDGVLTANQERTFTFDAGQLPSGVYLIHVEGESFTDTRRVTLLK